MWARAPSLQWPRNFFTSRYFKRQEDETSTTSQAEEHFEHQEHAIFMPQGQMLSDRKDEQNMSKPFTGIQYKDEGKKLHNHATVKRKSRKKWTTADLTRFAQLRDEGFASADIAKNLGRTERAVCNAAQRYGLATSRLPFTKSEDDRIRKVIEGLAGLAANDDSIKQVCKELPHRSVTALTRRCRWLASGETVEEPPALRRAYSRAEDELLKKLRDQRASWPEIQKAMPGRTSTSLLNRYRLIVPEESRVAVQSPRWWNEEQKERLRALKREGRSGLEISVELGKSRDAIYHQFARLKTPRVAKQDSREPHHWSKREREELLELDAAGKHTYGEIACVLNRTLPAVDCMLRKLRRRSRVKQDGESSEE